MAMVVANVADAAVVDAEQLTALARAFAERGAAMEELFDGEHDDLAEELTHQRERFAADSDIGTAIAVALRLDSLPLMRGAMQTCEGFAVARRRAT